MGRFDFSNHRIHSQWPLEIFSNDLLFNFDRWQPFGSPLWLINNVLVQYWTKSIKMIDSQWLISKSKLSKFCHSYLKRSKRSFKQKGRLNIREQVFECNCCCRLFVRINEKKIVIKTNYAKEKPPPPLLLLQKKMFSISKAVKRNPF